MCRQLNPSYNTSQLTSASSHGSQMALFTKLCKVNLFIFLSLRLKHGLEHKTESIVMTAFWCHRELPFGDQSGLTGWISVPSISVPLHHES